MALVRAFHEAVLSAILSFEAQAGRRELQVREALALRERYCPKAVAPSEPPKRCSERCRPPLEPPACLVRLECLPLLTMKSV